MSDSYADHPVSLTEAKATRDRDCRLWTPRDALINALREIDQGEINIDALVVVARHRTEEGETRTAFYNATQDVHTALGLLTRGQFRLMEND